VGEPRSTRPRTLQLEDRFDRLLPDKLAHVYQWLVPDRRQPIGVDTPKQADQTSGVNDEQASSHLRPRVLGSPEGESHHRQPDGGAPIEYAQKNGYSVAPEGVFQDEGYSGAILVRPGLEALRDLAVEGQIAAALVYSPDQLSRKYAYQVLPSEELSRCGVEWIFLKAPAGATPEDQLLVQFQGMIAE
jgi:hypothetical protein